MPLPPVTAAEQRGALPPGTRLSLYEHALRLSRQVPDGPLPDGGRPLPDASGPPPGPPLDWRERSARTTEAVAAFLADPDASADALGDRLRAIECTQSMVATALRSAPAPDADRARSIGLTLLRDSTERRAVWLALHLLTTAGRPADAAPIRTVGLLSCCNPVAVRALAAIAGTADLVWLADRTDPRRRVAVVEALCRRADPPARRWLLRCPLDRLHTPPSQAVEIARAVGLDALLAAPEAAEPVVAQALRLLTIVNQGNDYRAWIAGLPAARRIYHDLARLARRLTPSLDAYAELLGQLDTLTGGAARLLDWEPGERESVVRRLESLLDRPRWAARPAGALTDPDPAVRHRARWSEAARRRIAGSARPGASPRLSVEAVVLDPAGPGGVETRITVDGHPVVAAAFDRGPAADPEHLLERGLLRASARPRRVRLAEAWCAEECCGALHVTIVREGETVRWYDWHRPAVRPGAPPRPDLAELRFDAGYYDERIARAERDHRWEWPARTVSRLLRRALRDDPGPLARWNCDVGWIGTHHLRPEQVEIGFTYPRSSAADADAPFAQFVWSIPDDGTEPERQAEAALRRLAGTDPTTFATLVGGVSSAWTGPSDR